MVPQPPLAAGDVDNQGAIDVDVDEAAGLTRVLDVGASVQCLDPVNLGGYWLFRPYN